MKYTRHIFIIGIAAAIFLPQSAFRQKQEFDLKASIKRGKDVYIAQCLTCHMENGEGIEGLYPPLAKADYLMADSIRSIKQTLYGVKGEMTVNGKIYNTEMKGIDLTNDQASDVLNYVRNSWGNEGAAITPDKVEAARNK
ncbi:MAG TPA: cytochrome c [Chitinophagaceae bacterium]|nr:cytochrome c [Chitinophagaceae bacterium]